MITLRELYTDDLPLCLPLAHAFHAEGRLPGGLVDEVFLRSWGNLIKTGVGVVFGAFDGESMIGMLGALRYNDLNDGCLVTIETFWYVEYESRGGDAGRRLLDAYEGWARQSKAARVAMSSICGLKDESLDRLYRRNGYRLLDRNYIKEAA